MITNWLRDIRTWVWPILVHRAKFEGNWYLTKPKQIAYTIKALICLFLYLDEMAGRRFWVHEGLLGYPEDPVEVAFGGYAKTFNFEFGEGATWEYFAVGHGWRNWYYYIGSTGYP